MESFPVGVGKAAREARRPAEAASPGIAFFDFDHTLIHGDAGPLFGKHLFLARRSRIEARPHGPARFWAKCRLWGRYLPFFTWMGLNAALYKLHARRRSGLVRTAYQGLRGIRVGEFRGLLDDFVDHTIPDRIYPTMVAELRRHQHAGVRCVVVTTGMEELVARCLPHFPRGVELIGCRLVERNGRLTGRVHGPLFGVDKANILDAYCRALGVSPGDCWAYSDHYSDKEMLEAVGHPVAVNPRGRLRRLALRRGWRVLEPRLDRLP